MEEIPYKIDELNEGLDMSDVPAWKLIGEDRDAGH